MGSKCKTLEIFGYFAFWIAQNIALLALRQGMLTEAYTRNQHFWVFGGLSSVSQTGIPASNSSGYGTGMELWSKEKYLLTGMYEKLENKVSLKQM